MSQTDPRDIALFPQQNQFRSLSDLSGIWDFVQGRNPRKMVRRVDPYPADCCVGSWNGFTDSRDYLDVVGTKPKPLFLKVGSRKDLASVGFRKLSRHGMGQRTAIGHP